MVQFWGKKQALGPAWGHVCLLDPFKELSQHRVTLLVCQDNDPWWQTQSSPLKDEQKGAQIQNNSSTNALKNSASLHFSIVCKAFRKASQGERTPTLSLSVQRTICSWKQALVFYLSITSSLSATYWCNFQFFLQKKHLAFYREPLRPLVPESGRLGKTLSSYSPPTLPGEAEVDTL